MNIKTIRYPELSALSFPDAQVTALKIDTANKLFSLSIDNAYLDRDSNGGIGGGVLTINSWESFASKAYSIHGLWESDFDELKDVCEFMISDTLITLKGFGKTTGKWVEYTFTRAQAIFITTG